MGYGCISEDDQGSVGIFWDFTTFIFLLLQRRIFQSYYFLHVREDLIVQIGLSSKGNQLFSMWVSQEAKKRNQEEMVDSQRVAESVDRIKKNVKGDLQDPYDHFDALRVCDKTWFDGLTETIETDDKDNTGSTQIAHRTDYDEIDVFSDVTTDPYHMTHSYTDNQINIHDQSPKLPKGIRDIKHNISNVLFTGRFPQPRRDVYDSHETLVDEPKPEPTHPTDEITEQQPEIQVVEVIEEPQQGCGSCMVNLVVDLLIYLTRVLNTRTQAYRSIIIQLKKDRQECRQGMPAVAGRRYAGKIKTKALKQSIPPNSKSSGTSGSREEIRLDSESRSMEEVVKFVLPDDFDKGEHYLQRLLSSVWYFGQFQIDNVCYCLMLLNGMLNASLLSIPYLGFVFLWAMLSVPRPSKRFWVTAIGYTCIVIIVKYIFAFQFWKRYMENESDPDHPFFIPRIVGLETRKGVRYLDIAQLLVLFFQRGLLKVHGLWENYDERELDADQDVRPIERIANNASEMTSRVFLRPRNELESYNRENSREGHNNCCVRGSDWFIRQIVVLLRSPGRFYARVIEQEKDRKNTPTDMYIWMLGVDFICFIIIMFGYWAFGKHTVGQQGDITTEIKENTVPKSFLYLLIIHFFLILIGW